MRFRWIVRLEITVSESLEQGLSSMNEDGTETFCKHGHWYLVPKAIRFYKRKYPEMTYKIIWFIRLNSFFTFFGKQNDYLYPHKNCPEEMKEGYPFQHPHWWRTRIGFKTAWRLSK